MRYVCLRGQPGPTVFSCHTHLAPAIILSCAKGLSLLQGSLALSASYRRRICWLNMPSLKRLHAQGGSISHRQPNNDEGEDDKRKRLLMPGRGFGSERGGRCERDFYNGCLEAFIEATLTLSEDWRTALWLHALLEGVSCPLLAGTANSWRTPLPDSPHLQAASRSSSLHRGRPCQRRRRNVTSGSFNKSRQCVLVPEWAAEVVVAMLWGERERKELKW